MSASVLVPEPTTGALTAVAGLMPLASQELGVVRWAFEHKQTAGKGTDTLPGARVLAVPLLSGDDAVGVIAVQAKQDPRRRGGTAVPLIEAIARQAGPRARPREVRGAGARRRAARAHRGDAHHAAVGGLARPAHAARRDHRRSDDAARRRAIASRPRRGASCSSQIVEDARRLERVLGNLLQLTRVESGLVPNRELIPVEELVGAALTRMEATLGTWKVDLDIPADLVVPVDPVLFEQVLINLIDNAVKHGCSAARDPCVARGRERRARRQRSRPGRSRRKWRAAVR